MSLAQTYLAAMRTEFNRYKKLGDDALAQVSDEAWFVELDPASNSLAIVVKHLAGNLRSRWTDFFTRDGESPTKNEGL